MPYINPSTSTPSTPKQVVLSTYLEEEELSVISKQANLEGISVPDLIQKAVAEFVTND